MSPSDHFLFKFLTEFRGVPDETVTSFVIPQMNYWHVSLLLFALLFTDMLRYKPVILVSVIAGICYYATLRWTQGIPIITVRVE